MSMPHTRTLHRTNVLGTPLHQGLYLLNPALREGRHAPGIDLIRIHQFVVEERWDLFVEEDGGGVDFDYLRKKKSK
jgi:hypothetical protein